MSVKDIVVGGVLTVIVGGTAYTVSQADIIDNLANETGMTQQEAKEYAEKAEKEGLVEWTEVGNSHIEEGKAALDLADQLDCNQYEYEWETATLSCSQAIVQLRTYGNNSVSLGNSYKKLDNDSSGIPEINATIRHIDTLTSSLQFEIIRSVLDASQLTEMRNINAYNKSVLKAVLDSR